MKVRFLLSIFLVLPLTSLAQTKAQKTAGMVIKGDQEAPMVLYILPWQEPKISPPPSAPMQALLPEVVDHSRSLVEESLNRASPPRVESSRNQ